MKVRKLMLIAACLLAIFLAGCGGQEDAAVQEEDAISDYYTLDIIPLEAGPQCPARPLLVGSEVYSVVQEGDKCITSCLDIDSGEEEKSEFSVERLASLLNFAIDSEGSLYYLVSVRRDQAKAELSDSNKKWDMYLMKRGAEGEEIFFRKIEEEIQYAFNVWVDGEDRLCLRYDKLHLYDREGRYLGEEKYEADREKEHEIYRWKLGFEKFGISRKDIQEIAHLEDGRIEAVALNQGTGLYEIVLLTPSAVPFREGKAEIVLGMLQSISQVDQDVIDFNKGREDVYITVREYRPSGSPRTEEEAVSALMGDILAGNGPDLIAFGPGDELEGLAAQGAMEDLGSYAGPSAVIRQEDYLSAVWNLGKQGGLLYGIPMRFTLQTLAGRASLLEGREGWTAGDFMALAKAHPESLPVDDCSKSRILSMCIMFQAEEYLDREAGVSRFDTPRFREIMEFADTFAPDKSPASVPDQEKYQDGSILLMEADLIHLDSCLWVYRAFGMEPPVFAGYPGGGGAGVHLISRCNAMYGITAGSAYKQAAWEFIEQAARRDAQDARAGKRIGFPARRADLEEYLGRGLAQREADPELAEELREVILTLAEHSTADLGWENEALAILEEETASYFNGRKSLDKTIKVIENRMNLLLRE